jgi:hypothetical protein
MCSADGTGEAELRRALREEGRRNRVGADSECALCGDSTLTRLNLLGDRMICSCCLAVFRGRWAIEWHHPMGRGEGPLIAACPNCHAELTEMQRDWPGDLTVDQRLDRGVMEMALLRKRNPRRNK